jgi:hypothetical protein
MKNRNIHITKDGTRMLISDMDDNHLQNTINMIKRKALSGLQVIYFGAGENGEGDVDYIYGNDALRAMNYSRYLLEQKKRQWSKTREKHIFSMEQKDVNQGLIMLDQLNRELYELELGFINEEDYH